jgi:hypothetical protein
MACHDQAPRGDVCENVHSGKAVAAAIAAGPTGAHAMTGMLTALGGGAQAPIPRAAISTLAVDVGAKPPP